MKKDFHFYTDLWGKLFNEPRELTWKDNWLVNGYCIDCRYCCGPQDNAEPFPMALLPSQIHPGLSQQFYMLDATTAYLDARGCKALGRQGCSLQKQERPIACGLFPLVLANDNLWLYKFCPAVIFTPLVTWLPLARKAAEWLATMPASDIRRISIALDSTTLADRYINLHLPLLGND